MHELRPGVWHRKAPHPDWRPSEPWDQSVSSYAIDDGERLLLFDPLAVPSELEDLAAGRETAIVLTAPWYERDAQGLVERLGVPVYTPLPDTAQYLMDTYGPPPSRPATAVPTSSGCSARRKARHARTRPATGCRSVPTCFKGIRRTTPFSGSRASVR